MGFSTIINSQTKLKSNTENNKLSKKDVIVIENKFWIYPNPTSGNISIESDIPVTQAEFYSVLGKRVKNVISDFNSISIDELDHGIYFVKIRTDEGFTMERIIKN